MAANPTTEEIRMARESAGMTQEEAAEVVHSNRSTWQDWEYGKTRMHPGLWELFLIKRKYPDLEVKGLK